MKLLILKIFLLRGETFILYYYFRHRDLYLTSKSLSEVVEIVNRAESLEVPIRSIDIMMSIHQIIIPRIILSLMEQFI